MASRRATLEYLTATKIGERGQLTVPKQFRKDLGLGMAAPGSALTGAGLTPAAILATLPEARKRVFARHYKKSDSSRKTSRRQSRGQREK